jgi:hypothetical protein
MSVKNPKDFLFEATFNNPNCSTLILNFNDTPYYLMAAPVQEFAPGLHMEFEAIPFPQIPTISSSFTQEEVLSRITVLVNRNYQKKTLNITLPSVNKGVIEMVLKHLYDGTSDITLANVSEVHVLCQRFGIKGLIEKCEKLMTESIKVETLLEDYQKAIDDKSEFLMKLHKDVLCKNLQNMPPSKLFEFVIKLSFEDFLDLVRTTNSDCNLGLMYDLIENWSRANTSSEKDVQIPQLLTHVKLEKLSAKFLITKVKLNPYVDSDTLWKALEVSILHNHPQHLFALGKKDSCYDGYHLTTDQELSEERYRNLLYLEYQISKSI